MTNFAASFLNKKLLNSDNPAVIWRDRAISYSQLFRAVDARVEQLRATGIKSGNRVGIVSPNSIEYTVLLFSLWSIGAVACPLNTRLSDKALEGQLQQINARYLFTSDNALIHSDVISARKFNLSQAINFQEFKGDSPSIENFINGDGQDATILFTSGSCGKPKAVLHTLRNHIYSAKGSNELIPIIKGDRWLLSLPLYHVGGLSILFRTILFGGTIVIPKSNEDLSKVIKEGALTHISLVSTHLIRLLKNKNLHSKLQGLTAILIGGSAIGQSLLAKSLRTGLPVFVTYGSTELASQIATAKYPSSAKILNYRKIKISDEGEILAGGETLFSGYVENDTIDLPLNTDGWFKTGDLGYLNDEGGLTVTGRKDNMFISGGENIHPEEIERSLYQVEEIEKAVVVPVINAEFGFRPVAFIKTRGNAPVERKKLFNALYDQLPKFKIPERFYLWPTDPSAGNLKIDRQYLIKKAQAESASLKQID